MWQRLLVLTAFTCALSLSAAKGEKMIPVDKLVADLQGEDGMKRVAAPKELFQRGKDVLEGLKKAGAKQITPSGTIASRRLDVVYSLIEGLSPGNYVRNSFGLWVEKGTTQEEVLQMGKRHGFTLEGTFRPDGVPNAYVWLNQGKVLADVLRGVLASEPKVVSVNLNYVER